MKKDHVLCLILLICFLIPTPHYADDNDNLVIPWTAETLMSTLSLDYAKIGKGVPPPIQSRYSMNAWLALRNFFSQEIENVKNQQLVLHPQPLSKPIIVEKGITSGIHYWRVNQAFYIPELNSTLNFSIIVIKATNPPFMVQSLSMTRN